MREFYTMFDNLVKMWSHSHQSKIAMKIVSHIAQLMQHMRSVTPGWHYKTHNAGKSTNLSARSSQTKAAFKYFECEGVWHFARECPTRLNRRLTSLPHQEGGTQGNVFDVYVHILLVISCQM